MVELKTGTKTETEIYLTEFFYLVGNVQNYGQPEDIVSGKIDRGNRTWTFEAANGTKFWATLLNGNMVNGTGHQPDVGAFTFTATTAD